MLFDTNTFTTIEQFIGHLKTKDNIVGIVEYGSRKAPDMNPGGDYDLSLIFKEPVSENFNGVHFHIGGIPVDCMLLSVSDFTTDKPQSSLLLAHLNCSILFDRDNIVKGLMQTIKEKWKDANELSESDINIYRYVIKHTLDKLSHRLHENELFSYYSISLATFCLIDYFACIEKLEPGKPRQHIAFIQSNHPELYSYLSNIYGTTDLDLQYDQLMKASEYVLSAIGGLWKDDEVLFHLNYQGMNDEVEQRRVIKYLFN